MEIVGLMAGVLTTMAGVPQLIRVIRTRDLAVISTGSYLMLGAGLLLWMLYGYFGNDWILILSNLVTFVPVAGILFLKMFRG